MMLAFTSGAARDLFYVGRTTCAEMVFSSFTKCTGSRGLGGRGLCLCVYVQMLPLYSCLSARRNKMVVDGSLVAEVVLSVLQLYDTVLICCSSLRTGFRGRRIVREHRPPRS